MGLGEIQAARFQVLLHHREHLQQSIGVIADTLEERHGDLIGPILRRAGIAFVDQCAGDIGNRTAEGLRESGDFP